MYLHLGNGYVAKETEIIGIFDIENTSIGKYTKEFLEKEQKSGRIINTTYDMPKSYIIESKNTFISGISTATLRKRAGGGSGKKKC